VTIRLKAPEYKAGGPDGKGWNRLSLNAHMGAPADQCALQPRTWGTLSETRRSSRLAQWGNYGRCTNGGNCGECPLLAAKQPTLGAFSDKVLVRILERINAEGRPVRVELHLMNRPEDGWASRSYQWTWEELARLAGWEVGARRRDEHSDGFWLVKINPDATDGMPSPCPHGHLSWRQCRDCRELYA
jgi:hypothetical protein